jgi:hypothetical protein
MAHTLRLMAWKYEAVESIFTGIGSRRGRGGIGEWRTAGFADSRRCARPRVSSRSIDRATDKAIDRAMDKAIDDEAIGDEAIDTDVVRYLPPEKAAKKAPWANA